MEQQAVRLGSEQPMREIISLGTQNANPFMAPVRSVGVAESAAVNESHSRLNAIQNAVQSRLQGHLRNSVQSELARLLVYLPDLSKPANSDLICLAEIAISALLAERPNMKVGRSLRMKLDRRLSMRAIHVLQRAESPAFLVLFGLGVLAYLLTSVILTLAQAFIATHPRGHFQISVETVTFFYTVTAGAVGSVVAILSQIRRPAEMNKDPMASFLIGFTKPIIAASLAAFIYFVLSSKAFPIAVTASNPRYFFVWVGFLSGFSERFASDFIKRAERAVMPNSDKCPRE